MAILDIRRTDQRTNVRINPFWMTSGQITYEDLGNEIVLFSFPEKLGDYVLHAAMVEISTPFAGTSPVLDCGYGLLASDAAVTGDTLAADTDPDKYLDAVDMTSTAGYVLTDGDSALGVLLAAGTPGDIIRGSDTADEVPCITAVLGGSAFTAGVCRIHVMLSKIQG